MYSYYYTHPLFFTRMSMFAQAYPRLSAGDYSYNMGLLGSIQVLYFVSYLSSALCRFADKDQKIVILFTVPFFRVLILI